MKMNLKWSKYRTVFGPLGALIVLTLFILACGADVTSTPTTPPLATATPTATQPAAPTATSTPTVRPERTPRPTPTPTATARPSPTATPTPTVETMMEPVSPRLKVSIPSPGNQVTMYHKTFFSSGGVLRPMYDFLIWNDLKTDEEKPMLATDWTVSSDAKIWTFDLRAGIPFHDGTEFTSKDVRRSWEIITSENSTASGASDFRNLVGQAENIDISDPYKVVFNLTQPWIEFGFNMSEAWTFAVYSADHWDMVGEDGYLNNPVGTGPFRFAELKVNEHLLYERFKDRGEDHWWKIPEFDELQFLIVPEAVVRLATLLAGEAHIADIPRPLLPQANESGFKVVTSSLPGLEFRGVIGGQYFDEDKEIKVGPKKGEIHPVSPTYDPDEPFRDVRVRKALNLAIDRKEIQRVYFGDGGIIATVEGIPPYRFDHKDSWTPYPYDPEEAKNLLTAAGYPNGFDFDFRVGQWTGLSEAPEIAEVVAGYWQAVGLTPNLIEEEIIQHINMARTRELARTVIFWQGSINLYRQKMQWMVSKVTGAPGYAWEYERLDDLYIDLAQNVDPNERLNIIHEMGDFVYNNYFSLPLFLVVPQAAIDPEVVLDYSVNMRNFGPVNYHEFTEPVYK